MVLFSFSKTAQKDLSPRYAGLAAGLQFSDTEPNSFILPEEKFNRRDRLLINT